MLDSKRIIVVLVLFLFSLSSHSQVYKWVDENGKVHYSDKKPAADAVDMNISHNVMPAAKQIEQASPIHYSGDNSARWLLIDTLEYVPQVEQNGKRKIASFYFGGDCATPTSIFWQELDQQYPEVLPKDARYFKQITNAFYSNGYQIAVTEVENSKRQQTTTQAHRLVAHIVDMKLEACASTLRYNQHAQNLNDFNIGDFKKAQNWIEIKWMLYDYDTAELIYENTTEGVSANNEEGRSAMLFAIQESLKAATLQLLSDKKFVSLLKSPPKNTPDEPPPVQERSMFEKLRDTFDSKYRGRALFVNILTGTAYLKTAATEHYARDGRWAAHLDDLNLKLSDLYTEDQVRSITLRFDGTIDLDVSPSFGRSTSIWLIPIERNNGSAISWSCQTNVEAGNGIGGCTAFN